MSTLKFKTTINCGGCIAKVSPVLNAISAINKWEVDIMSPQKILQVETDTVSPEEIISQLQGAGFKAEKLD